MFEMSVRTSATKASEAETRQSLISAAAEVFADRGFRAATVREICERAHANIAAVNYHFGDKEQLYLEVLKQSHAIALKLYPPDLGLPKNATPEQRLEAYVRSFLRRIFSEGPSAYHGKLMVREMIEPTAVLDRLVEENLRPMSDTLWKITRDLLGKQASEELVRRCGMSVVSQVLFYHHCRPVITRMFPDMKFNDVEIERLAQHITRFSLAALKELADQETR